ncbi:MAG: hypothetical protein LUD17_02580 [Bacteroidales bacterium]|nr:hypothetical protein [Bacteroidales bacterium]
MNRLCHIFCITALAALASCHSDEPHQTSAPEAGAPLYPVLGFDGLASSESRGLSRDETDGSFTVIGGKATYTYYEFNKLYPIPINKEHISIGAFLVWDEQGEGSDYIAGSGSSASELSGVFEYYNENLWTTSVKVLNRYYYLYGFMPANLTLDDGTAVNQTLTMLGSKWSDGAIITLDNFPVVTDADVCVVTGVKKGTVTQDAQGQKILAPISDSYIVQGEFGYQGEEKDNYIYLLLNHLYTNVNLELKVDAEYAALRTIRVKQVEMVSSGDANTITLTIKVQPDPDTPIQNIQYTRDTSVAPAVSKLFPKDGATQLELKTDEATSIPGYFAPAAGQSGFFFTFTYDVYDKDYTYSDLGNLVRENCTATNHWTLPNSDITAGKSFTVPITVRPTYLYQLSNPDLDNPTFEFTE